MQLHDTLLKQLLEIVDFCHVVLSLCLSASVPNLLAGVQSHSLCYTDNLLKQYKRQQIYNGFFFFLFSFMLSLFTSLNVQIAN